MEDLSLFSGLMGFVLGIIALIVFFNMASNIKAMKKAIISLEIIAARNSLNLAKREEWKGNNSEAVDHYLNYLYEIKNNRIWVHPKERSGKIDELKNKIEKLGGRAPKMD